MRKIISIFLLTTLLISPLHAADQWDTTDPAGTSLAADIDTNIIANNEALDRVLIRYRRGLGVNYATVATLSVLAGEIAIPDSSDGTVRWRRTTAATSITWADIDTGAEASSTQYYLYATADTDITGMVFKISASSSAPSGSTYYIKIAEFYNNSSGNIERLISYRQDDGADYKDVIKGWVEFDGSGTVTINDHFNVSSITDNATGDYTVNWVTAFASGNYAVVGSASDNGAGVYHVFPYNPSTTSVRIIVQSTNASTDVDLDYVSVIAIGSRT